MKILGDLQTKQIITKSIRPVVRMRCDHCEKELTDSYARITTSHSLWGNDSWESFRDYELCFECAVKLFGNYTREPQTTEHLEYEVVSVNDPDNREVEVDEKGDVFLEDLGHYRIGN